ncbi:MAG: HAD family hydrolase [Candidatus Pacearchaeota archaeon]
MSFKNIFTKRSKRYIFFDFDGTICDAYSIGIKSFVRVLDEYGCKADKKIILRVMGTKLEHMLKEVGLDPGHIDSARRKFYKYFKKEAANGGIKLCVNMKPLREISKEYNLIIISNSETTYIKKAVKILKINGLFRKIYGAEKFGSKDGLLIKLFKKYKLNPSEIIYVGDRFSDVECAKNAGCISVAIHNKCSWSDLKTIKNAGPDYLIKDFYELKNILEKLNKKIRPS